jgi:hypothetical protein
MNERRKYWTIGEIDATGVRGPHEKELEDISNAKFALFTKIDMKELEQLVKSYLGGKLEDIGLNEDWTITLEMFPDVCIHMAYSFFGDEFGDGVEAEFKFYFSGKHATWVPGEDSATFIGIIFDFIERLIKGEEPFEKEYDKKTELMEKVLVQRDAPFNLLNQNDKEKLAAFIGGKVWITTEGWRIKREFFPEFFVEVKWNKESGLDIGFSGEKLNKMSSYHAEFIAIFLINHVLRYITIQNEDKNLPDICYIMFSRLFTKEKDWVHRTR